MCQSQARDHDDQVTLIILVSLKPLKPFHHTDTKKDQIIKGFSRLDKIEAFPS
jgi:hypothetical protein